MYAPVNDTRLYLDIDGAELRVDDEQLVTVPRIVVLHGGPGFDQGYLRPGIGPLRDLAQLVFVDLRGQGRSDAVPIETCTLEQMADDITTMCALLGFEQPILLGHSAGGFVALHAALRAPDAFGGLILCNTSATLVPEPDPDGPNLAERAGPEAVEVAARVFAGDVAPETYQAFGRLVAPHYAGPTHMDVPGHLFPLSQPSFDVIHQFFARDAARYDLRPRLGEISLPTLVLAGGHDWVCPPAAARTIAAAIPKAQLAVLEETGHFSFSEEPAQFHQIIASYIHTVRATLAPWHERAPRR